MRRMIEMTPRTYVVRGIPPGPVDTRMRAAMLAEGIPRPGKDAYSLDSPNLVCQELTIRDAMRDGPIVIIARYREKKEPFRLAPVGS